MQWGCLQFLDVFGSPFSNLPPDHYHLEWRGGKNMWLYLFEMPNAFTLQHFQIFCSITVDVHPWLQKPKTLISWRCIIWSLQLQAWSINFMMVTMPGICASGCWLFGCWGVQCCCWYLPCCCCRRCSSSSSSYSSYSSYYSSYYSSSCCCCGCSCLLYSTKCWNYDKHNYSKSNSKAEKQKANTEKHHTQRKNR